MCDVDNLERICKLDTLIDNLENFIGISRQHHKHQFRINHNRLHRKQGRLHLNKGLGEGFTCNCCLFRGCSFGRTA